MRLRTSTFTRVVLVSTGAAALLAATMTVATANQPKAKVVSGPATISAVNVNETGTNHAFVTPTDDVAVTGSFKIGNTGGAVDQIEIGWAGSDAPSGCVYVGAGSSHGTFSYDLGPTPSGVTTAVIVNFAQDNGCNTDQWWSSNAGPAIGDAVVAPPTKVVSGAATYTSVGIDTPGADTVVRGPGASVTLKGFYKIANTGGVSASLLIGWAGASQPIGCLYSGPSNQPKKKFTYALGTPPAATGTNTVVAAFYPGCDLTRWSSLTKSPLAVVYVDRTK